MEFIIIIMLLLNIHYNLKYNQYHYITWNWLSPEIHYHLEFIIIIMWSLRIFCHIKLIINLVISLGIDITWNSLLFKIIDYFHVITYNFIIIITFYFVITLKSTWYYQSQYLTWNSLSLGIYLKFFITVASRPRDRWVNTQFITSCLESSR